MLLAALIGLAFGFIGSIPVAGPIAALVFERGLVGRFRSGVFISLGAAVAEGAYAFLAFWGFSRYLTQYSFIEPLSRAVAAAILVALGIMFARYRSKPDDGKKRQTDSAAASFAVGLSITALNPTFIATWTAVVTMLYSTEWIEVSGAQAVPFALGSVLGIVGWFATLLGLIRRYRDRFTRATIDKIVRGIGWFLLVCAVYFAVQFVRYVVAHV
ncbi:MAG: LysE family transporter [Polyangiaceae bacterium]|nr:LysE family transporter [Polyangiaceae bacterium]